MNELLKLLKEAGIEVSEEVKGKIEENLGKYILKSEADAQAAAQRRSYQKEKEDLQKQLEGLVSPAELEKLKTQLAEKDKERENEITKLRLQYAIERMADKAGAADPKVYALKFAELGYNGKFDDAGNLVIVDQQGNPKLTTENKVMGLEDVTAIIKEKNPWLFPENSQPKPIPTPGNPPKTPTSGEKGSFGASLAKQVIQPAQKSNYFKGGE